MTVKYTHGHGPAVLANHLTRTAQDSLAFVLPYLHRDSRLLDVGCGPGSITLDLAAVIAGEGGSASQVVGVENTPAPVTAAEELARRRGIGAVFMTGDAQALPFQDGTFDVVVAHQVLQHLGDPVGALREFARVAAPGGIVAVRDADYEGMFFHPQPEGMLEWQRDYRRRARPTGASPMQGGTCRSGPAPQVSALDSSPTARRRGSTVPEREPRGWRITGSVALVSLLPSRRTIPTGSVPDGGPGAKTMPRCS